MSFPLDTLAPTITVAGISAPSFDEILQSLQASFQQIYGSDAYFAPDSQDGQWMAVFAKAISDTNDAIIAAYNQFSPITSVGEGFSSVVKINGINRNIATHSQVSVVVTGGVGTTITNGKIRDTAGHTWLLPTSVTIPGGGTITVTATAEEAGDIRAAVNTVNIIATPVANWNSVNNPSAGATPGEPIETDAALRRRQAESVANPAQSILVALLGGVKAVDDVVDARIYENSTGSTDANGIPARSIAVVVAGGDSTEIAQAILLRKPPGTGLFGATTVNVSDGFHTYAIKFTVPDPVTIKVAINLTAHTGYTADVGAEIKTALVDYFSALPIGEPVYWSRVFKPINLLANSNTFDINTLNLSRDAGTPAQSDVAIAFDEVPIGNAVNIVITVV